MPLDIYNDFLEWLMSSLNFERAVNEQKIYEELDINWINFDDADIKSAKASTDTKIARELSNFNEILLSDHYTEEEKTESISIYLEIFETYIKGEYDSIKSLYAYQNLDINYFIHEVRYPILDVRDLCYEEEDSSSDEEDFDLPFASPFLVEK